MSDLKIFDFSEEDEQFDAVSKIKDSKLFDFLREEQGSKKKDCVTVYLAGPIEHELTDETPHAISWRNKMKELFDQDTETLWDVRDPNKGKTDGKNYIRLETNSHHYNPYVLFREDIGNVAESDFIVVNLSRFVKGFGTPFELGYAYCKDIPIVCICEPGIIPEHPFITQSVDVFVYSEEEAVNVLKFMLNEEM